MSQNEIKSFSGQRLFFLDVIRLFTMIAIVHFHIIEASFYTNDYPLANRSLWEIYLGTYTRFMSFSGFTIIIISYFLIGLRGFSFKKLRKLFVIAFVGLVILFIVYGGPSFEFEWDIYSYIACTSFFIFVIRGFPIALYFFSALGLILILLPPDLLVFPSLRHYYLYNAFFGDYWTEGAGGWPLIPWFGFPVFFFTLGKCIRRRTHWQQSLQKISTSEKILWLILLCLAAPQWGSYIPVPVGSDFAKFINNKSRVDLFSHLLIIFFFMRLSFIKKINDFAAKTKWLRWVSKIYLNKKFFLYYIVQWILVGFFSQWSDLFLKEPLYFDLALTVTFPLCEFICHLLIKFPTLIRRLERFLSY